VAENCHSPYPYLAPPFKGTPLEYYQDIWRQKTTVPLLPCGVVGMMTTLAAFIELQLATDRQLETDP